jgi:NarL family two-component system response regulator YdfI
MYDQGNDLKLLIISRDLLARAGLSSLLERESGIELVGQAVPGEDLESSLVLLTPDLILWDLGWDDSHGEQNDLHHELEQLSELASEGYSIMALIGSNELARDVWVAGAKAILHRDVTLTSLRAAINSALNDLVVLDESIGAHLLPEFGAPDSLPAEALTPRELQVLQQMAQGSPNKIIANHLGVSEHTIKFHVTSIFKKLGVRSRTEAVVRGTQLGLILL